MLHGAGCEVLVIDGSPEHVFAQNHAAWSPLWRHEKVEQSFGYLNDKVNGIHTGVNLAGTEKIILADDDVRYTPEQIERVTDLLDQYEVVRPQNFLAPLPWWARMEAARMLINRATLRIADYPGTCAFQRAAMLRVGHYDGDVLFDNEEIIRHFAREGATIDYAADFFVQKRPPDFRKWIEQRPRQAYEDFGLRAKTALFFALPWLALVVAWSAGWAGVILYMCAVGIAAIILASAGRARGHAAKYFLISVCVFAPLWVGERVISTYWALYWHFAHGGYPFGDRVLTKGIGRDWIPGGKIAAQIAVQRPNK